MRGESVQELAADGSGIVGDRRHAFQSSGAPAGKPMLTGKERAAMLLYTAGTVDGRTHVRTPAGESFGVDEPALLRTLEAAMPQGNHLTLQCAEKPFTDCRPIALLSLQAVEALAAGLGRPVDVRRFRANILLDFDVSADSQKHPQTRSQTHPEDSLVGQTLRIGNAALLLTERDPRCRMVTLDPETAAPDPLIMKHLDRHHQGCFGAYARTITPGSLRVGDPVFVL